MAANYVLLEKITVGAAGASSVTFNSIPQTGYTDLLVKWSMRDTTAFTSNNVLIKLNGVTTSQSNRYIYSNATTVSSATDTPIYLQGAVGNTATANTFSNCEMYIPNYNSTTINKSVSIDGVTENNATASSLSLVAGLYASNSAVTSIQFAPNGAVTFMPNSTFYLYGVAKLNTTPAIVPYATGGDTIMTDGTYWYHAFLSSGTFTPAKGISCDVLLVAGGGGGGGTFGGNVPASGGGAGGAFALSAQSLGTSAYTVTVGAGGAAGLGSTSAATDAAAGNNSSIGVLTAAVGGGAGSSGGNAINPNVNGGSGGGGKGGTTTWGTGTAGQGNRGGDGAANAPAYGQGGGGGAGAVGGNGGSNPPGAGGAGLNTWSSWLSVTGLGVSGYVAGGGGGAGLSGTNSTGGSGGGGFGANGNTGANDGFVGGSGTANTGGGGGGGGGCSDGGSGGSGLVIVRYLV